MQSEAQELEMVKMSKFVSAIGQPTKEEQLREAAKIHIRIGNIQRYCELMVDLGEVSTACAKDNVLGIHSPDQYFFACTNSGSEQTIPVVKLISKE